MFVPPTESIGDESTGAETCDVGAGIAALPKAERGDYCWDTFQGD